MYVLLITLHLLVCILLTVSILLQSSKGGGLAGTFGGGGGAMGAVFGGRGAATFLSKVTTGLAAGLMFLALLLGLLTRGKIEQSSLIAQERERRVTAQSRTVPQIIDEGQLAPTKLPAATPIESGTQQSSQDQKKE